MPALTMWHDGWSWTLAADRLSASILGRCVQELKWPAEAEPGTSSGLVHRAPEPVVSSPVLTVHALVLHEQRVDASVPGTGLKRKRSDSPGADRVDALPLGDQPAEAPAPGGHGVPAPRLAVAYVCCVADKRGKFLPEKAKALGVPPCAFPSCVYARCNRNSHHADGFL
jgi:hypothetical protein